MAHVASNWDADIESAAAITQSDTAVADTPSRQLLIICTVAGNVKVRFLDGTLLTFPVNVGMTLLPWSVVQVFSTLTTATATFYSLT